jgi:phospholipid transport system substrate-binding protein
VSSKLHGSPAARSRVATLVAILVILALALFAAGRASAATITPASDPIAAIKYSISQAVAVFNDPQAPLAERRERLRALCEQAFDFQDMSRSVLGYHWRELTPAQRDEFVPIFARFIQDAFLTKLQDETVQKVRAELRTVNIAYVRETFDGPNYAEVFSTVTVREQTDPFQVTYLMHRTADGWRVYDLTLNAISVIGNYRNQFNRVINNQGYDQLVADLRAKETLFQQQLEQGRQPRS